MKNKKPVILLFSILLSLSLFSVSAVAAELDVTSAPDEAPVAEVVNDNVALAPEDTTELVVQKDTPAITPLVIGETTGQILDVSAPTSLVTLSQKIPTVATKALDTAKGVAQKVASTVSQINIKPAKYDINVGTATFTIAYNQTELYLSGKDITLENGAFNYNLYANAQGRMIYNNDLSIAYQGVDGKYSLNYDMHDIDHHTMIAGGSFDNLLKESPLLKSVSSKISNDTYSYNLSLWTNEGFSFNNSLSYAYAGKPFSFSVGYAYDLASDVSTWTINGRSIRTVGLGLLAS